MLPIELPQDDWLSCSLQKENLQIDQDMSTGRLPFSCQLFGSLFGESLLWRSAVGRARSAGILQGVRCERSEKLGVPSDAHVM